MGLDIVEMVVAVEQEFGVELPNAELSVTQTIGELHDLVAGHLGVTEPGARDELWTRLLRVLENETGVARERLVPSARFVHDLGLD